MEISSIAAHAATQRNFLIDITSMKWLKRFILFLLAVIGLGFLVQGSVRSGKAVPEGFVVVRFAGKNGSGPKPSRCS